MVNKSSKLFAGVVDDKFATRLFDAGLVSSSQLTLLDAYVFEDRLGVLTKQEQSLLAQLVTRSRRLQTRAADQAVLQMQAQSACGKWLGDQVKLPTVPSRPDGLKLACHCGCCDSVFSLKAYLFDLLDLLAHTWRIDLRTVEKLLLRSFDKVTAYDPRSFIGRSVDLNCDTLNTPMPQAAIACEVLEVHVRALARQVGAAWPKQFVDGLLRLILPREIIIAAVAAHPPPPGGKPQLTVAQARSLPGLPSALDAALAQWAAELITLTPDLAGIVRAYGLLADDSAGMLGPEPGASFAERREATLRQWLTGYRDALRAASGVAVDVLEASLFLSLDAGACRTTTRLQELVTSVQQIVESVRSGEIASVRRTDLPVALLAILQQAAVMPLAESAWTRLRDFETWLGFTYGWVYPENVLSPLMPNAFQNTGLPSALQRLIDQPLTDQYARTAYLDAVVPAGRVPRSERLAMERAIHTAELKAWKQAAEALRQRALDSTSDEDVNYLGNDFGRNLWFPLAAGLLLNRNQQYATAHAWYRLLFDPQALRPAAIFATIGTPGHEHAGDAWLDDAFDPVSIANRRPETWLRHSVLAMVRNLIDWADDEFARGLPDTVQRAKELYELARRTLQAPPLQSECELVLLDVVNVISDGLRLPRAIAHGITRPLAQVRDPSLLARAQSQIDAALNGKASAARKRRAVERVIAATVRADHRSHPEKSLAKEHAQQQVLASQNEDAVLRLFGSGMVTGGLAGGARGAVRPPDHPFDEPPIKEPPLDISPPAPSARFFCMPRNPVLRSLQLHIDTQLQKLRLCLDFLGEPQVPRVYGCDTYDAATGTINRPTADLVAYNFSIDQPRYRYNFLIEKARQYVDVAQRIGSLLLQALQNSDAEGFAQLKARHAIELADATTELRRLGRREAEDGVKIAGLQSDRADDQAKFWESRAGDDVRNVYDTYSQAEKEGLEHSQVAINWQTAAAVSSGLSAFPAIVLGAVGAAAGGATVVTAASGIGLPISPFTAAISLAALGGAAALGQSFTGLAQTMSQRDAAIGSLRQTQGSFERRFEEWKNQFELAKFDARIADAQVTLANDRLVIAGQELQIAQLQLAHAREELRFLQTKVTNLALYDWMVRVLSRDYRTLMQVAACVAKMAQRALEFERQETVQFISGDYSNVAQGVLRSPALTDQQRSLGLLGAERLLTDLTRLDAHKLTTERRRLQLTKTFSLARMMPTEMVQFRETGTITFNTLFDWFDEGFQGHFLRLIKSVRVSVLAIVPPVDGIHGMLHNTGESSVVVQEAGEFVVKRTARNFGESIALDAAFNESGLFVLNHDDPMLLPFEGLGVQTQWTLELPPGNNRFDFSTIVDVFLTIEYTAEHSRTYEDQMRRARRDTLAHEDMAFPLRMMFPDQWYHLKNRRSEASGGFLRFATKSDMFSPNLRNLAVAHITLLISGDFSQPQDKLALETGIAIALDSGQILQSSAAPAFGPGVFDGKSMFLSTRGSSAAGVGTQPRIGASDGWSIKFGPAFYTQVSSNTAPLMERLTDVLLVVTVSGLRA